MTRARFERTHECLLQRPQHTGDYST
jgi:hypothetical protein